MISLVKDRDHMMSKLFFLKKKDKIKLKLIYPELKVIYSTSVQTPPPPHSLFSSVFHPVWSTDPH